MEKSNLIISIIIVLCIATAVAAYGIINNPNAIFSDLASMGSGSGGGHGVGNNTTQTKNPAASGSGSSGSGSGSGSSGGSSGGSGSGSGGSGGGSSGGGGSGGGSSSGPNYSASDIAGIAESHIMISGCHAGTPSYQGGYWSVPIINDTDGSVVGGFTIDDSTGTVSEG